MSLSLSPDGRSFVSGACDASAKVWTHISTPVLFLLPVLLLLFSSYTWPPPARRQPLSTKYNVIIMSKAMGTVRQEIDECVPCGPSVWNKIPQHVGNFHSSPAFRKALETYQFPQLYRRSLSCMSRRLIAVDK